MACYLQILVAITMLGICGRSEVSAQTSLPPLVNPSGTSPALGRMIWAVRSDASLGRVSHDGRYIPFFSSNDERGQLLSGRELFLRDGRTQAVRRLTRTAGDAEAAPGDAACICVLSRDARQIAYVWWTFAPRDKQVATWRAELRVLRPAEAGFPTPQVVFPGADNTWLEPYDWTPDARWIVVQMYDRSTDTARIAMLSTGRETPRVLKVLHASRLNGALALSPDGRYLAAMVREETSVDNDIFLFDLQAGRETALVTHPGNDVVVGWEPAGQRLVFTSDRGGSNDLWSISVGNGHPTPPRFIRSDVGTLGTLGLTSAGSMIYQRVQPPGQSIRIDSLYVGSGRVGLTRLNSDERPFDPFQAHPAWSHDGRMLAYVIGMRRLTLVHRSVTRGEERRMDLPFSQVEQLVWAPDDSAIAIAGADVDGKPVVQIAYPNRGVLSPPVNGQQIFGWSTGRVVFLGRPVPERPDSISVIERALDRGTEREVYRGPSSNRYRLSRDGRTLFLLTGSRVGTPSQILTARDVASGLERPIASSVVALGEVSTSAGGKYLTASAGDGSGTWVFSTDGEPARFLRGLVLRDWAVDDRYFLASSFNFIPGRLSVKTLWLVDAVSFQRRRVEIETEDPEDLFGLVVSPDGHHVVRILADPIGTFGRTQGRIRKTVWELPLVDRQPPRAAQPSSERPALVRSRATVSISTRHHIALDPGFAGYNVALMAAGIPYTSPRLSGAAGPLHAGWLRYPAGTRAGAFDWRTGNSRQEWVDRFKGTRFFAQVQDAFTVLDAKGGERIDDAYRLAQTVGASGLIVTVNVMTDTPQSAGALAAYARSRGIKVLAWELGNEPTLLPTFFAGAHDYATKMRPFAEAIRAVDPNTRIAICLDIAGMATPGWDSTLARFQPRFWNVLSYHHYPRLRAGTADLMAALNEILADETDRYVRDRIGKLFGAMPVIITEAAPGSGNDVPPGSSMIGTLYGGLWAAEYAMRLARVPQVKHVGIHQFLGPAGLGVTDDHLDALLDAANAEARVDPEAFDYGLYLSAQGAVYGTAAGVLNAASAVYETRVTGGPTVSLHSARRRMPAIYAQAYRTGPSTTILLTNKGADTVRVDVVVEGKNVNTSLQVLTVTGSGPGAKNTENNLNVTAREATASGLVTLLPFSLTRISWTSAAAPLSRPPR